MNPYITDYFSLKEKVAFISGASGYLGSSMAICLASAGAHVLLNGRNQNKLFKLNNEIKSMGFSSEVACFDIKDERVVKNFFQGLNKLNIIVNNAYNGGSGSLDLSQAEHYAEAYSITLISSANILKYSSKILEKTAEDCKQTSSVINIASMYGVVSPDHRIYDDHSNCNPPYYGSAKAALIQFSKYSACELGNKCIRVNSISPGPFPNMDIENNNKSFVDKLTKKVPLNRVGKPNELNGPLLFLASNASSYVTGSNLVVDGGWTCW